MKKIRVAILNNGMSVLARMKGQYAGSAVTYANDTQARTKVEALAIDGIQAHIWSRGPVRYIVIDNAPLVY